jgi:hypothetical protein
MDFIKIMDELNKGRFVVWIDDKVNAEMSEDYMKKNFVGFADNLEKAAMLCRDLQDAERDKSGRSSTRLRITSSFDDYVCSEDTENVKNN